MIILHFPLNSLDSWRQRRNSEPQIILGLEELSRQHPDLPKYDFLRNISLYVKDRSPLLLNDEVQYVQAYGTRIVPQLYNNVREMVDARLVTGGFAMMASESEDESAWCLGASESGSPGWFARERR